MRARPICLLFLCLVSLPAAVAAAGPPTVITGETRWQGRVEVKDDVLVTENGHLTIAPGAEIVVFPSEGTRTDPQFYSTETEIVVRGKLTAGEAGGATTVFRAADPGGGLWAGIIADGPGASLSLTRAVMSGAHSAVTAIDASIALTDCAISGCRYGVTLLGRASGSLNQCTVRGNDFGLADYAAGATMTGTTISGNREKDILDRSHLDGYRPPAWYRLPFRQSRKAGEMEYLGEHSLDADTTWAGRVVIRGQVAVQPGATLTILPGTEVAFRKTDTNGDGLGESQLLILGIIKVLGTPENWVLFTSAEAEKKPGDWDKVSLISSESPENVVRYARFEYGYQAFHNHFSRASLTAVIFNDNYRGVQFQESPGTSIEGAWFTRNRSAMRFRDSKVRLRDCLVEDNITGINFLRCDCSILDSVITGTLLDPLLGRESATRLVRVMTNANREGPRFKGEGSRLEMLFCSIHRNLEDGLSLTDVTADIRQSDLSANGLDGLSVTGGQTVLEEVSLAGNGRWAVDNNGRTDVDARRVWWGSPDHAAVGRLVYDRADDPSLGAVRADQALDKPPGLFFAGLEPVAESWSQTVRVIGDFAWPEGRPLRFAPGARVFFEPLDDNSPFDTLRDHPNFPGSELMVTGSLFSAVGTPDSPIRFGEEDVSDESRLAYGGVVNIERAQDLQVAWCIFGLGPTGLHLRESAGTVEHSVFLRNGVGLRFNTSKLTVRDNLFIENSTALRFHFGEPEITGNAFRRNRTAVFISDDPGTYRLAGNNFEGNTEYNLSLGEPVEKDVEAGGNWWGTASEEEIEVKFFDGADSSHLGRIIFRPAAGQPFPGPVTPGP